MALPSQPFIQTLIRQPRAWFDRADELVVLLDELAERVLAHLEAVCNPGSPPADPVPMFGLYRAFLLLSAYAVENYLKGLWVAENVHRIGSTFPGELASHRMQKTLVNQIRRTTLSESEKGTLAHIERAMAWYAKYPSPKEGKDYVAFGPGTAELGEVRALVRSLKAASKRVPLSLDGSPAWG